MRFESICWCIISFDSIPCQLFLIIFEYYRDAALMAFGCILEGPDPVQLKPLVEQAMPMLIETMKDSSVVVKVLISSGSNLRS